MCVSIIIQIFGLCLCKTCTLVNYCFSCIYASIYDMEIVNNIIFINMRYTWVPSSALYDNMLPYNTDEEDENKLAVDGSEV